MADDQKRAALAHDAGADRDGRPHRKTRSGGGRFQMGSGDPCAAARLFSRVRVPGYRTGTGPRGRSAQAEKERDRSRPSRKRRALRQADPVRRGEPFDLRDRKRLGRRGRVRRTARFRGAARRLVAAREARQLPRAVQRDRPERFRVLFRELCGGVAGEAVPVLAGERGQGGKGPARQGRVPHGQKDR